MKLLDTLVGLWRNHGRTVSAHEQLTLGVQALRAGNFDVALRYLENAARHTDPEIVEAAAVFRVQTFLQMGRSEDVVRTCISILARNMPSIHAILEADRALRCHLRPDDARAPEIKERLDFLRKILQDASEKAIAWSDNPEQKRWAARILNDRGPDLGPHFWTTAEAIGLCQLLWEDLKDDPETRNRIRKDRLDGLEKLRENVPRGDALYSRILAASPEEPLRFLLYLRSFALEAVALRYESDPLGRALVASDIADLNLTSVIHVGRPFEKWLQDIISRQIEVLAIMNPRDAAGSPDPVARLEIQDERWQRVVRELIPRATVIVQRAEALTKGVQIELKQILESNRVTDLLIVVNDQAAADAISRFFSELPSVAALKPAILLEQDIMRITSLDQIPVLRKICA